MSEASPALRSRALHLRWESPIREEATAVARLQELSPAFAPEEYVAAWRAAAVLDRAAFELAEAWFASRGAGPYPTAEELELLCPGFPTDDYATAIHNNVLWARK